MTGKVQGVAIRYPTGYADSSKSGVDYQFSTTGDSVVWTAVPVAYQGAQVCVDVNDNGFCDAGEDSTVTAADGGFALTTSQSGPLTAVAGNTASYLDPNSGSAIAVPQGMVLRAAPQQVQAAGLVVVSALSTEVLRLMEADGSSYSTAQENIAARLSLANSPALPSDVSVTAAEVLSDLGSISDANALRALSFEEKALQNRAVAAAAMLDRGFVTALGVDPVHKIQTAQAAAYAPENIPRYDHLFVVIFENHPNEVIDSPLLTNFYNYLNTAGNRAANYFSTGDPSEPNYTAVASGDDWGITNDSGWNCMPANDTADAPTDVYNPLGGGCVDAASHNQKGRRNLFSALYNAGLDARVYSESMDPGQDPRVDGKGNSSITGVNKSDGLTEPMISDLYKTKHHPPMHFDEVRNRPDFFRNLARTVGGGQWDAGIAAYAQAHKISWNTHQLENDLKSGDIGALNFIIPDQCDDMHSTGTQVSDCTEVAYPTTIMLRGDAYAKYLVDTIQASPIWKNQARAVGIVLIFDEGSYYLGSASCCGWNPGGAATSQKPLDEGIAAPVPNYAAGNEGDGPSIFAVLNNQPKAPKGIYDSDVYSHISFNRTLQDMFGLADPGVPTSYMNRSKYTQAYIAAHAAKLPEYASSANAHFDAVRPMNHQYVEQIGDPQSWGISVGQTGSMGIPLLSLGPDPNQTSIWALK